MDHPDPRPRHRPASTRRPSHRLMTILGRASLFAAVLSSALGMILHGILPATDPWPASVMLRHIAAAPNCAAARAVGLAPAYRGQPGYYLRHDRDNDGIACEPWPGTQVQTDQLPAVIYPRARPPQ